MKILNRIIAIALCAATGFSLTACGKNYDGTYRATTDVTDVFVDGFNKGAGMEIALEGELDADFILTLENGKYEMTLDTDKLEEDLDAYMTNNIDTILKTIIGIEDEDELNELVTYMGYADYSEMKDEMLNEITSSYSADDLDFSDSGKYTVSGDTIKFISDDVEAYTGDVKDGNITIEMEDEDAVFGGDALVLVFKAEI